MKNCKKIKTRAPKSRGNATLALLANESLDLDKEILLA